MNHASFLLNQLCPFSENFETHVAFEICVNFYQEINTFKNKTKNIIS